MKHQKAIMTAVCAGISTLVLLSSAPCLNAANGTDTWTGGAGDNNWATGGNWTGINTPPIAGDSLAFGAQGTGSLTLNNTLTSATSFAGLTFNAGAPAFILTGNSLFTAGGILDNSSSLEIINLPISMTSAHTFGAVSGGAMLVGGVLSGTGGVNKTLGGTVTLTNNNTYTGATTVSGGTLALDFTGGAANNIVSASSALAVAGGTLQIKGSSAAASSQAFASTALSAGNSTISAAPVSGANLPTVAIKAITPAAGSTVVFNGPATTTAASTTSGQTGSAGNADITTGFQAATATITTTSGTANQPLLSTTSGNVDYYCYGTVGLYDFAAVTGTTPFTITGLSQINSTTSGLGTAGDGSYYVASTGLDTTTTGTENTTHFDDIVGSFTTASGSPVGMGGLRYNYNGPITTTLYNGTTICLGSILVTPNVGANNTTVTTNTTSGFICPGFRSTSNAGSLAFWQNNIGGFLSLNIILEDGKTGGAIWSQNGLGTVVYGAANTFTNSIYLNGGVSVITTNAGFGAPTTAATIFMNGGTILANATMALDNSGANKRGIALGNNGGGLASVSGYSLTVDGVVSGSGQLTVGLPASNANGNTVGLLPGTGTGTANTTPVYATGTVNLIGTNTYTGNTFVSTGTLMLSNTASIGNSTAITVASGAVFDVSQLSSTFTLGASQSLLGNGTNNGSITTSAGSKIYADAGVPYGTNTFNNNLTFVSGALGYLNVGTVHNGSNDFVSVGGTLTLNSTTFHLKGPSTAANLDTTADYVLLTAGTLSGSPSSTPVWDVAPANAANFVVTTSGNSVVLHYSPAAPPSGSGTATPASVNRNGTTLVTVTAVPGSNPISSVILNASSVNGPSAVTLVQSNSTSIYTNTVTVGTTATPGPQTMVATITDTTALAGTANIALTVLNTQTWDGNGANANWSTGTNWVSGVSPVTGDFLTFAGSQQTAPAMDNNYNVTGLAFSSGAASFTLGASGNFLTLTANGITNYSANAQTVNLPITLTAPQTFNANVGALNLPQGITNGGNLVSVDGTNITTISGAISGAGGLAKNGGGTNYLTGNDSYAGATTINAGSLVLNGNETLPGAIIINSGNNTMLTVSGGTLSSSSLTMNSASASLGFLLSGGTASFTNNVAFSADNGNNANLMQLTGGSLNANTFTSGRCNLSLTAQPTSGQVTTEGIYVNSTAVVTITNTLGIGGASSSANSSTSMRMDGGTVNVGGTTRITINNSGRWSVLDINGGTFTSADATGTGIQIGGGYGGASAELLVRAGKLLADTITLGDTNGIQTNGTVVLNQTGGSIYLGAGGIVSGSNAPTYTETITLGSGTVGALANWASSLPMTLSGTMTFQAADGNNNPFNITLNGVLSGSAVLNKTGGGTLTLGAADTYTGNTLINGGTLALSSGGSLTSPTIQLGTSTTFDVTQVGGITLNSSQALKGFGTVNGTVTANTASTIAPGSNTVTGTLTFTGGLTENGGVNNTFNLSSNPSGPNNDFINASGGLSLSGSNNIIITGTLANGGIYPLFNYGGNLSGDFTQFAVSGAVGTLSNSAAASTIYFVNLTSFRAPTNVVWLGNPTANNWDMETTTNWLDNGVGLPDIFVPGDNVVFNTVGAANPLVNLPGLVNPASVLVNTADSYTFTGIGAIGGLGGLTVSNGSVTVLTTNTFTGPTILAGGVLTTPVLANGGSASGLGAATADPGNLVFNGGTLAYSGASTGTDHGLTLTNGGGTLDVINGTTLTWNGALTGNGRLALMDSGTLTLAVPNTYSGGTTISNGVLKLNNATAAGFGAINLAGGALQLSVGSQPTYTNSLTVIGNSTLNSAGGNNNIVTGAWTGDTNAVLNVTIASGGTFTVEGSLTNFYGTVELGSDAGCYFRFNGSGNTSFGGVNATFDLGTGSAALEARNATTIAIGALEGGSGTIVTGPSAGTGTLLWTIGSSTNNPSTTYYGTIKDNAANENSAINKVGSGTLTLAGSNPYSAGTTVSSGTLLVTGSLSGTNNVTVTAGTLGGSGSIAGAVIVQSGGTLEPGDGVSAAGTVLTLGTNLTMNTGSTNVMQVSHNNQNSDNVLCSGVITYGGTLLVVTNAGDAPFVSGDTFTLFTSSLPSYSGSFNAFNLPALTPGLVWNTANLTVNGTISVGIATPSIGSIVVSGGNLILTSTNGSANGQVIVLTSTNLTVPFSQWTPLTTNNYSGTGSFSYTVTGAVTSGKPQQFYRLLTQ